MPYLPTESELIAEIEREKRKLDLYRDEKSKSPVVRIDKSLEKYKDQVLFKDKLDKANEMLKTTGLPKSRKHN